MSAAIAQKLDEARARIENGWCQKNYALTRSGEGEWPTDPDCVCFCSLGAIMAISADDDELETAMKGLLVKVIKRPIITWNDAPERTQAEVIEAFRKAAELARAERAMTYTVTLTYSYRVHETKVVEVEASNPLLAEKRAVAMLPDADDLDVSEIEVRS